jgi:thioredoxin 1
MAGANLLTLTGSNFDAEVKKGVVLVDFWAPWCGPCRMLGPVVEALSDEMKGQLKFGKVNVDEQPELSEKFEVASIPTILLLKDGKIIANRVGAANKEALKEWIGASLKG